jgi:hypothetical protein
MTCRLKKAKQQRELDDLVFSVLVSCRHYGAIQWVDWHELTRVKRGQRGIGHSTFADAVKRLVSEGRVRRYDEGCYQAAFFENAGLESGLVTPGSNFGSAVPDAAMQALEQLLSRKSPGVV